MTPVYFENASVVQTTLEDSVMVQWIRLLIVTASHIKMLVLGWLLQSQL